MRLPNNLSPIYYTIQAVVGTLLEQIAIVALGIWVLPYFSIHVSWWVIAIIMVANLAFSIFTYVMGLRALRKLPTGGTAGIIGCHGTVITPLDPTGYVKVRGELWKATSNIHLDRGDDITVTGVNGLVITVIKDSTIQ